MLRLGLVDLDTSHAIAFTQRLNHIGIAEDQWVEGAQVVLAYPGMSLIAPELIAGYTEQLRDYGVQIVASPETLLGQIDAVLVESQDGSVHLDHALPFIEAGIPTFVDKPFTTSVSAARRLVTAARRKAVPLMSASALRYTPEVVTIQTQQAEFGTITGCDAITPALQHPRNPGLFHYGVHGVEMIYALMGTGCAGVRCISSADSDLVIGRWADGRLATVRGVRRGAYGFTLSAVQEKQVSAMKIDGRYFYREMLKQVVAMVETGRSPVALEELVEVVAFQEAALRSSERDGTEVLLTELG